MKTATSLVHVAPWRVGGELGWMTASNPLIKSRNMHQDPKQISPSEGRSRALLPADSRGLLVTLQAIRKCRSAHTHARVVWLSWSEVSHRSAESCTLLTRASRTVY